MNPRLLNPRSPKPTAILQSSSSQINILRAEIPGALPVWGAFAPLKLNPDEANPQRCGMQVLTTGATSPTRWWFERPSEPVSLRVSSSREDFQENGNHVGRNHVGRFTRTGCMGMLAQVHGLHHEENTAVVLSGIFLARVDIL